jgi:hypothetical protein
MEKGSRPLMQPSPFAPIDLVGQREQLVLVSSGSSLLGPSVILQLSVLARYAKNFLFRKPNKSLGGERHRFL